MHLSRCTFSVRLWPGRWTDVIFNAQGKGVSQLVLEGLLTQERFVLGVREEEHLYERRRHWAVLEHIKASRLYTPVRAVCRLDKTVLQRLCQGFAASGLGEVIGREAADFGVGTGIGMETYEEVCMMLYCYVHAGLQLLWGRCQRTIHVTVRRSGQGNDRALCF